MISGFVGFWGALRKTSKLCLMTLVGSKNWGTPKTVTMLPSSSNPAAMWCPVMGSGLWLRDIFGAEGAIRSSDYPQTQVDE